MVNTTPYKEANEMTPEELIARFEGDIVYDAHNYGARFRRSNGRKELESRGISILPQIIDHLQRNPPGDFMDLRTAWGHLLNNFAINIGEEELQKCPQLLKDTQGWIDWATQAVNQNPQ